VALLIVMMVIAALTFAVFRFAAAMRVETQLARNSSFDTEYDWMGRSGVELAKYVLTQQMSITPQYDALNQKWAGGPGGTNEVLSDISLTDVPLGPGKFTVKIVDTERKYNINAAIITTDENALRQGLTLVGVPTAEFPTIVDSILDWGDVDKDARVNGAESDYYQNLQPPYIAKDGPIDDLSELLLIRGITPGMYWGSSSPYAAQDPTARRGTSLSLSRSQDEAAYTNALVDIFTPTSARLININTASPTVLQMVPGIDENIANAIVGMRAGPDGQPGTEDDTAFRGVGDLASVPGFNAQAVQMASRYFTTRSVTFEVRVEVDIGGHKRTMAALVRRTSAQDATVLYTYWE